MPGAFTHLAAAGAMFAVGWYYFKEYFQASDKTKKLAYLGIVCVIFTFIPDIFLVIYYTTHVLSFSTLLPYHDALYIIVGPIAVAGIIFLKFGPNIKYKPIFIMGMWCMILHVIMDYFLPDHGIWY